MRNKEAELNRDEFIKTIVNIVNFWKDCEGSYSDKLEGVAHSILATLDGCSADVGGYYVIPISSDELIKVNDIAGDLHECFCAQLRDDYLKTGRLNRQQKEAYAEVIKEISTSLGVNILETGDK